MRNAGDQRMCVCCGARLAALTFPPSPPSSPTLWARKGGGWRPHLPLAPFLSHAVGEEGGRMAPAPSPSSLPLPRCGRGRGEDGPHLPLAPFLSYAAGEEGGEGSPHLPPSPCRSSTGRGRGKMSRAAAILRLRHTRSPLSRSAGEGPGVRAALTIPPTPIRSNTGRGRGEIRT
jgi:hypothetical protein